ncbi:MAG: hypothetical protein Rubg2KO_09860 [Rubricoccaceae bacterium]
MLNVALVGLLAGSLLTGPVTGPDDGDDKDKNNKKAQTEDTSVPTPGVFDEGSSEDPERSIVSDTYAFGFPSDAAPIKFWASYAFGNAKEIWNAEGDSRELSIAGTNGNIESQRIVVGAQINAVNFPAVKLGVGGELRVAQNKYKLDDASPNPVDLPSELSSGYKLQNGKVYATARGRVLGAHAGMMFDLGNEQEFTDPIPALGGLALPVDLSNSDGDNAIFVGLNFDYPSERVRLFGGIDYYHLQDTDEEGDGTQDDLVENSNYLNFTFGGGVKFSAVEVGAALNLVNRFFAPTVSPQIGTAANLGGHAGTVSPYIRISPQSLPASIFVQGGVLDEYNTYGYAIGGANSIKPAIGFTAGVSIGFE